MSDAILVAIISALATAGGSIISVFTANRVTNFKIEVIQKEMMELKEETKKHNSIIERTYGLEQKTAILDEQMKVANHRISDLENAKHK